MDDKRIPMDPAEVVDVLPKQMPQPQTQEYYGTAMPETPKKDHTGLVIVLSLLVIVFGTMLVVFGLLQLRVTFEGGHLKLSMAEKNNGGGTDKYESLTPSNGAEVSTQPTQPGDTPTASLRIDETPQENGMTVQAIYNAVSQSVVCVQVESYYGTVTGTGVVMSEDGYIITTENLISGAASVKVILPDGTEARAKSVATDTTTGVAVILADRKGLTPAQFGTPDTLAVGDTVYCIANPYGEKLRGVFSDGIVSSVTNAVIDNREMTVVQTTAVFDETVNGCPVINSCGQIVAITTAAGTYLTDDGSDPHLAISMQSLKQVVDTLLADDTQQTVSLGIQVGQIPQSYRVFYGFPGELWITKVGSGTYADGMLYEQDVITAVDGTEVTTVAQYRAALALHEVGDMVVLTIYRTGRLYYATLPLTVS